MSKIKWAAVIVLIFLLGTLNLYLAALDAKMDYEILMKFQEQTEEAEPHQTLKDWAYDENDPSTWWYEGHTVND